MVVLAVLGVVATTPPSTSHLHHSPKPDGVRGESLDERSKDVFLFDGTFRMTTFGWSFFCGFKE